jgi:hypothetical protein
MNFAEAFKAYQASFTLSRFRVCYLLSRPRPHSWRRLRPDHFLSWPGLKVAKVRWLSRDKGTNLSSFESPLKTFPGPFHNPGGFLCALSLSKTPVATNISPESKCSRSSHSAFSFSFCKAVKASSSSRAQRSCRKDDYSTLPDSRDLTLSVSFLRPAATRALRSASRFSRAILRDSVRWVHPDGARKQADRSRCAILSLD